MSRFYFQSPALNPSRDNGEDIDFTLTLDDEDNLPYPVPLQRESFLEEDFSPSEYLSALNVRTRHQTLEDLRSELRQRSQDLSKELLDLVNSNYQDFLGLGGSLTGGEEKVEEVRVGLLGFQRGVQEIKTVVEERRKEVDRLLAEREQLWRERQLARTLLDLEGQLTELEERLLVISTGGRKPTREPDVDLDSEESSDADEDDGGDNTSYVNGTGATIRISKLRRHVQLYQCIQEIIQRVGPDHPFVKAQDSRMIKVRNTLLLDLSTALREAKSAKEQGRGRLLKVLGLYRNLGEAMEAIEVVKH